VQKKRPFSLYFIVQRKLIVCVSFYTQKKCCVLFVRERPGFFSVLETGWRLERGGKRRIKYPTPSVIHTYIYIKREGFGTIIPEALAMAEKKGKILEERNTLYSLVPPTAVARRYPPYRIKSPKAKWEGLRVGKREGTQARRWHQPPTTSLLHTVLLYEHRFWYRLSTKSIFLFCFIFNGKV